MTLPLADETVTAHVAILLATRNGARWLEEQLESIALQDVTGPIDVFCSDDGSEDGTRALLARWQQQWTRGRFAVTNGPRAGFSENFRALVLRSGTEADYVAFCDQDDIWLAGKLRAAIATIGASDGPALYGSRTTFVNAAGKTLAMSPLFTKPPSFENALVQNIIAGNTAVFNRAGFALMRSAAERTSHAFHDWFAYLIVSGAGGVVRYSPTPYLYYRQHGGNAVGGSIYVRHKVDRVRRALGGTFRDYVDQNIRSLYACQGLLTERSRATLALFEAARTGPPAQRLKMLRASGVHRQSGSETLMLYGAALIDRL